MAIAYGLGADAKFRALNNGAGMFRTLGIYEAPPREPIPSKQHRDFILTVGLPDNPFGREIPISARSSLEAGAIAVADDLIPHGYVAHSLTDPWDKDLSKLFEQTLVDNSRD